MGPSINREKVIKGLDEITHYNGEQMFYNDIFIRGIADDALAMLKEQEPVKPTWSRDEPFCGACDSWIRGGKFCIECGKPILWEGK